MINTKLNFIIKYSKSKVLLTLFLSTVSILFSQEKDSNFYLDSNYKFAKIKFELVNNLIIVPVLVNDTELEFILDSGVATNVIFNLRSTDTLSVAGMRKIALRGLGSDGPIEALYSTSNSFRIGTISGENQEVFIISDRTYDVSSKLGTNVHGVLGYDFFKNLIVEIDYIKQYLKIYRPDEYPRRRLKRHKTFPLVFFKEKPYIDGLVKVKNDDLEMPVHLLVDTGGGDNLWVFQDENLEIPEKNFGLIMGEGLSGTIYGKKARIKGFSLGEYNFKDLNISFPDQESIGFAKDYKQRNGSIGGGVLSRFHVVIDYPNEQLFLKKNSNFRKPFTYNLTGMEIVHDGQIVVEQVKADFGLYDGGKYSKSSSRTVLSFDDFITYAFKPKYKVYQVYENSLAYKAGIRSGDQLVRVNGDDAYEFSLEQLNGIFSKDNHYVKLVMKRSNNHFEVKMKLTDELK
ncbi:MAG: aspartyl protease family protein [Flavobacteriaceae bacterium]